jgi:addiction module RelE/StbE family toxin
MAQVVWSEQAVRDLEEIHRFIARDSLSAAQLTIERIRESTRRLLTFPESGRSVPEAPEDPMKELIVRPFRVIYRIQRDNVQVLTVLHGARQLLPSDLGV